jgi:integrase
MAKGRRGNNEGSITERKDGRWQAAITVGNNEKGEPKRIYFYGKTRSEVADKLKIALTEQLKGTLVEPNKIKLNDWLDYWLENYAKLKVRQYTFYNYSYFMNKYVKPRMGHVLLRKLTPPIIQKFYASCMNDTNLGYQGGLSAETIRSIHIILNTALKEAVHQKIIVSNPMEFVTKPKSTKKELHVLTPQQLDHFLEVAKGHPHFAAFVLEWATGLRRGELLGLKWSDIDFDNNRIMVRRSIKRVTGKGIVIDEPKTAMSNRNITIPPQVIQVLIEHRERQERLHKYMGDRFPDTDFVFRSRVGTLLEPVNLYSAFKEILEKAGLPNVRFHDMRHSHATMLLLMGEHPKVVQERLGHKDIGVTLNTYSHVVPGMQERVAERIGSIFNENLLKKD